MCQAAISTLETEIAMYARRKQEWNDKSRLCVWCNKKHYDSECPEPKARKFYEEMKLKRGQGSKIEGTAWNAAKAMALNNAMAALHNEFDSNDWPASDDFGGPTALGLAAEDDTPEFAMSAVGLRDVEEFVHLVHMANNDTVAKGKMHQDHQSEHPVDNTFTMSDVTPATAIVFVLILLWLFTLIQIYAPDMKFIILTVVSVFGDAHQFLQLGVYNWSSKLFKKGVTVASATSTGGLAVPPASVNGAVTTVVVLGILYLAVSFRFHMQGVADNAAADKAAADEADKVHVNTTFKKGALASTRTASTRSIVMPNIAFFNGALLMCCVLMLLVVGNKLQI